MRFIYGLLFVVLFSTQTALAENSIEVTGAWINEAPPTVKVLAGYFTISNLTGEAVDLVKAGSPAFEKIEFHLTETTDGVARMQKLDAVTIPAQSDFSFVLGAHHLMLFNPATAPKAGEKIPLQLTFSNGVSIDIEAEVKRGELPPPHHHH